MRLRLACLFVVAVVSGGFATPAQAAELPVPYGFLPQAILGGMPDANAPGTNDWSCKPSAAHPRPVVLVHGTLGNKSTNWQTYGPLLKNNGYCVFALTYGKFGETPLSYAFGGMASMTSSAKELKAFVAKVLSATGARKVDLIGHSQGTLMPQYYVRYLGGAASVKNYISLAPLWHGTQIASPATTLSVLAGVSPDTIVPICTACGEFAPESDYMAKIRAGGVVATPGVVYTNIMTKNDELVVPYASGIEPGMKNIVLQDKCPLDQSEHFQIASSRTASGFVLNALDPAHATKPACTVVLPFVGGV